MMDRSPLLLLTVFLTITTCQKIPAQALTSMIQSILSPKNTEHLSLLIKDAANRELPESLMPNKRIVIQEAGIPRNVARNEATVQETIIPRNIAVEKAVYTKIPQIPKEVGLPKTASVQTGVPKTILVQRRKQNIVPLNVGMQITNELTNPTKMAIKKPECLMPKKVFVKNSEGITNRKILVQKANEIPMLRNLVLQIGNTVTTKGALPNTVLVKTNEISQVVGPVAEIGTGSKILAQKPKILEHVSEKVVAPSPFSAVTSTATLMPSTLSNAVPQSRGQFLRKIPIPPPTI